MLLRKRVFTNCANSVWLEIKVRKRGGMSRQSSVRSMQEADIPPTLIFIFKPGGTIAGAGRNQRGPSFYEGAGVGPNVAKVKESLKKI